MNQKVYRLLGLMVVMATVMRLGSEAMPMMDKMRYDQDVHHAEHAAPQDDRQEHHEERQQYHEERREHHGDQEMPTYRGEDQSPIDPRANANNERPANANEESPNHHTENNQEYGREAEHDETPASALPRETPMHEVASKLDRVNSLDGWPGTIMVEIPESQLSPQALEKLKRDFGVQVMATRAGPNEDLVLNCDHLSTAAACQSASSSTSANDESSYNGMANESSEADAPMPSHDNAENTHSMRYEPASSYPEFSYEHPAMTEMGSQHPEQGAHEPVTYPMQQQSHADNH